MPLLTPPNPADVTDAFLIRRALARGLLDAAQIEAVQRPGTVAEETGLLERLRARGLLDARQTATLLAAECGLGLAPDLATLDVAPDVLATVPRSTAVRDGLLPMGNEGGTLRVAVADPLETEALEALAVATGLRGEAVVATPAAVTTAIERLYGPEPDVADGELRLSAERTAADWRPTVGRTSEVEEADAADAPILHLVQRILEEAVSRRASDIHLEPFATRVRVRFRIDGALVEAETFSKRLQLPVVSRLKIMANLSIAEKRLPQDGRIPTVVGGRQLDLRVSALPTAHGESIVMRILDKQSLALGLSELGFLPEDAASFERLISVPDGIALVAGPTGSGKTTTLYGCLHYLNHPDRKIITVEDPVEYQLNGINQVPVRPEVGMTFASALRAMLRQAPNVVMVGEIRDLETAEIAINAALTGHTVFSTLHTNDAPGAVTRLVELGVKPFLVASALRGVLAQRLVRTICPECRRPVRPEPHELQALGLSPTQAEHACFAQGGGCQHCSGTGYRGRMGLFEILVVNDELRKMIYENAGIARLRRTARSLGMRTLREDGARKAAAGLTTIADVVSLTVADPG